MAAHGPIHRLVDDRELRGITADEMRREFSNAGAGARRIGGQIGGAQGTDLAESADALVGLDLHHRGVEDIHGISPGPLITPFVKGKLHAVDLNFRNHHSAIMHQLGSF